VATASNTIACVVFVADYSGNFSRSVALVTVARGDLMSAYANFISWRFEGEDGDVIVTKFESESDSRLLLSAEVKNYIIDSISPFFLDKLTNADSALQIATIKSSLLVSSNLLTALDAINCTSSPSCASLNQNDCSAATHTSGVCLTDF
jgi:hypothetical protein